MSFLPMSISEAGDSEVDFVFVSGDAYVDHPSFANALIGRWIAQNGYSVGMIAQPDWHTTRDFMRFGRPRLGFLVSAGNMDSMVNLYTVAKKPRKTDAYAPGGKTGLRPRRASIVYTNRIREAYGDVPVILGGVEASLRRFAHYDYWDDAVRQSILADSGADLLVYGMGETPILQIAEALESGIGVSDIVYVKGTCYTARDLSRVYEAAEAPSFIEARDDKEKYCDAYTMELYERGFPVAQMQRDFYIVQNPPADPLTQEQMDRIYGMDFLFRAHPSYTEKIPALAEVQFSITSQRGCIGGCSYCSIYFHQGKQIQARSEGSILLEARKMTKMPGFKGYIHDVGGPTANFYGARCKNPKGPCRKGKCLYPAKCRYLKVSHDGYIRVLKKLRGLPGVKKVFIRSGVRYDYALMDDGAFIRELAAHHVSGQLKVAPEHVSRDVLSLMGKPDIKIYKKFVNKFNTASKRLNLKQYVLPYFMSSHPGCTLADAVMLAEYMRDTGFAPEQVQDFYPTPGTAATCMYYTGMDPATKKPVYVARDSEEKEMQRALLQYRHPKNRRLVLKALKKAGREDLIGKEKRCLLRE
jgi:uncharacterized radical SAM protein YgiQ